MMLYMSFQENKWLSRNQNEFPKTKWISGNQMSYQKPSELPRKVATIEIFSFMKKFVRNIASVSSDWGRGRKDSHTATIWVRVRAERHTEDIHLSEGEGEGEGRKTIAFTDRGLCPLCPLCQLWRQNIFSK